MERYPTIPVTRGSVVTEEHKEAVANSAPLPHYKCPEDSDSKKAEVLADSLQDQFQPVKNPLEPSVIEMANEAMHGHEISPASGPKLTSFPNVLQTAKKLKAGKAPFYRSPHPAQASQFLVRSLSPSSWVQLDHVHMALSVSRGPGVFMNFAMREHYTFDN
jgi:hypothetical protein